jgi:S-adenosyl methyltransferase
VHNRTCYDPLVLCHARALLVSDPAGRTAYIDADFTKAEQVLTNGDLQAVLDLTQPVGLLMIAVLMLVRDSDDPWTAARTLMDALPSGSYLAITHPGQDFDPAAMDAVVQAATSAGMTLVPRDHGGVQRFFGDWELVEPGVVPVMAWHPEAETSTDANAAYYWAGLARKP